VKILPTLEIGPPPHSQVIEWWCVFAAGGHLMAAGIASENELDAWREAEEAWRVQMDELRKQVTATVGKAGTPPDMVDERREALYAAWDEQEEEDRQALSIVRVARPLHDRAPSQGWIINEVLAHAAPLLGFIKADATEENAEDMARELMQGSEEEAAEAYRLKQAADLLKELFPEG
jgi:hypothetical protein